MASNDPPLKNSAYDIDFPIVEVAGTFAVGATISSSKIRKDGGAFNPTAHAVTEISDGVYNLALDAAEMNADQVSIVIVVAGLPSVFLKLRTVAWQIGGQAVTSTADQQASADVLLGRNIDGGSSAGRIVSQALDAIRNKWTIAAGTLTVYKTDDTTSSWTATTSTSAGNPLSTVDPA